ncbi:MAG: D-alanyl-D-alanine carboxypeptidase/D-alanyl-D-alanine-endopeptidase [Pseudomonadota bacterium]
MIARTSARIAFALVLAWHAAAHAQLPESIARQLEAAGISQDALGLVVMRGEDSVLAHGATRSMHPASTIKLLTTMASLDQLGPTFRGRTELRSDAALVNGVLDGDLYLKGGADADFNSEALSRMLHTLRNAGIKKIKGRLVLDRQLFNPARPDLGAPAFDEAQGARYNVIPDALLFDTNLLSVDLRADAGQLYLAMQPPLEGVSIDADMELVDANCEHWKDGWKPPEYQRQGRKIKVILHGSFPKHCTKSASIDVLERHDFLDRAFRAAWSGMGGVLRGPTVEGTTPPHTRLLADHVARALPELIRDTNKVSDNTLARTLYLSLGSLENDAYYGSRAREVTGGESTAARAELAVRAWMRGQGIDDRELVLENGSGLSRTERISAMQMAGVLQAALRSTWAPEFQSSLPIAALDGTMRRRLRDTPAAARARLKTGALKDAVAIAGYVPDAQGRQCVVVAMINHELVGGGAGRAILDAIVEWVSRTGSAQ